MPYRKTHPGLDQVLDDDRVDAFITSIPLALEEPPPRLWPAVALASTSAATVGVLAGVLLAGRVAVWAVLLVALAVSTALAAVAWLEQRDD